jgi:hypothetical protein
VEDSLAVPTPIFISNAFQSKDVRESGKNHLIRFPQFLLIVPLYIGHGRSCSERKKSNSTFPIVQTYFRAILGIMLNKFNLMLNFVSRTTYSDFDDVFMNMW